MDRGYVLIADLAQQWEIGRSNALKYVKAKGLRAQLRYVRPSGHGQKQAALSVQDAELACQMRREDDFIVRPPSALEEKHAS
jgi:hypothetical protein